MTTKAIKWFTATGPAAFFPTERTTTPPPQPKPPKSRRPKPRPSLEAKVDKPHKGRDHFSSKYFPTIAPNEGGHFDFDKKPKPKRSSKAAAKAIPQHHREPDFKPTSDRRALREKVKEWTEEPENGDRNEVAIDYPKNENRKFPHFPPLDEGSSSSPVSDRKKGRPPKAKKNKYTKQTESLKAQLFGQLKREKAQLSSPFRFPGSKKDRGVRFPGPLSSPRRGSQPEEAPTPAALKSKEELDGNFGTDFGHGFSANADSDSFFFPSSGKGRFLPFENAKFNGDAARKKKRKNGAAGVAEKRTRPSAIPSSGGVVESRRENWGRKVDNRKPHEQQNKHSFPLGPKQPNKPPFGLGQKTLEQLNKKRTELERKKEKEAQLLEREAAKELLKLHEEKRHIDHGPPQKSSTKSHQHFKLGVARENYAPLTTPPPPVPRTTIQPIFPTYPPPAAANPTAGPPYSPRFLGGYSPLPPVTSGYGAPDLYGRTVPKKFIQDNMEDHFRERRRDSVESKRKAANFDAHHHNRYPGSQHHQKEKKSGGGGLPVFDRPILKSEKEPSWFASFGPSGAAAPPATATTPRPQTASPTAPISYPRRSGGGGGEHRRQQHPHPSSRPSGGRGSDAGGPRRSGGGGGSSVVLPPPIAVTVRPYGKPPFPPPRGASAVDGEIKGRLRKQQSAAAAAAAARSFHQQQIRIKKRPPPPKLLKPKPKRPLGMLLSPSLAVGGGGGGRRREEEELMRLQRERQRLLELAGAGPSLTAAATAAAFPFRAPVRLKAADNRSGISPASSSPSSQGNPFEDPFASRPLAFPAAFSGFGKSLPSSFAYSTSSRSPSPFGLVDTRLSRRRGRL